MVKWTVRKNWIRSKNAKSSMWSINCPCFVYTTEILCSLLVINQSWWSSRRWNGRIFRHGSSLSFIINIINWFVHIQFGFIIIYGLDRSTVRWKYSKIDFHQWMANDLSLNEFVEEICFAFFSFSACFYLVSSQSYSDVKKMLIYPAVFHQLGYLDVCVCVCVCYLLVLCVCMDMSGERW